MKLFLQKNATFSSAGGSAPRPPQTAPHCEFLATRLHLERLTKKYKCLTHVLDMT